MISSLDQRFLHFFGKSKERGEVEGEQMVAPPDMTRSVKTGGEESPSSIGQGGP